MSVTCYEGAFRARHTAEKGESTLQIVKVREIHLPVGLFPDSPGSMAGTGAPCEGQTHHDRCPGHSPGTPPVALTPSNTLLPRPSVCLLTAEVRTGYLSRRLLTGGGDRPPIGGWYVTCQQTLSTSHGRSPYITPDDEQWITSREHYDI